MSPPKGYVLGPGEELPGSGEGVKASRESTAGALTLIESETTGGAPLNVHEREDECFYVLEGSIAVRCGDEVFEAPRGSFAFLPRGVPHTWDVTSGVARVLIIAAPAGLEKFLRKLHESSDDARGRVAAKHGIRFVRG